MHRFSTNLAEKCIKTLYCWRFIPRGWGPLPHMSRKDDVITWKRFTRFWPFVRGIHRLLVDPWGPCGYTDITWGALAVQRWAADNIKRRARYTSLRLGFLFSFTKQVFSAIWYVDILSHLSHPNWVTLVFDGLAHIWFQNIFNHGYDICRLGLIRSHRSWCDRQGYPQQGFWWSDLKPYYAGK